MKKSLSALCALALGATLAAPAFSQDAAIKARQGLMRIYAHSLGQLGAMAKGEAEFNAEAAQKAADNLVIATTIDQSAMWPPGTDYETMPEKTAALKKIWTDYPDIVSKGEALVKAAKALQANAGSLDGIRANIGAVGGACGGCHKVYRHSDN